MPKRPTKKKGYLFQRWMLIVAAVFVCLLVFGLGYLHFLYLDTQCTRLHSVSYQPPNAVITADDWFERGNYDYDRGDCVQAIADYTHSLALQPNDPEVYNNRAYTFMRLQQYEQAVPDLDQAILFRPTYIHALMNRGDIYNYYYRDRKKALADYDRILAAGAPREGSLCGHRLLALYNGWSVATIWQLVTQGVEAGCR